MNAPQAASLRHGFIVVPAFNEAEGIGRFLNSLTAVLETSLGVVRDLKFTILVVDDGSQDLTAHAVESMRVEVEKSGVALQCISFMRNFGHQAALVAGMSSAVEQGADFVVTVDADGEQPVSLIPVLLEHWLGGADMVHTRRISSNELSLFKRVSSLFYYRILSFFSKIEIRPGMADFKLWDGYLLKQTYSFLPHCGSTRVFASWISPKGPVIDYQQNFIEGRVSRYSIAKMLRLAFGGLLRYSDLPLRFALFFGIGAILLSFALAIFAIIAYFLGATVSGWSSLMVMITFLGGMNAFLLGLLCEYLLRFSFRLNFPVYVDRRPQISKVRGPR
jgi:glycosyltransferase involved in cell wall biosynthesis